MNKYKIINDFKEKPEKKLKKSRSDKEEFRSKNLGNWDKFLQNTLDDKITRYLATREELKNYDA